ncbi:MAG: ABC transporter permease [Phycisphaerales bacterium]|nr:ABC transporter permease [Phycisphaerales bacterium]MCB9855458.1 ABC transporter permease [Phycisphaerales bacterium]MCB9864234.1 ABC transporter permease [Phycisphaerales bacterium]
MIAARFVPLVCKQVWRARTRSLLTIAGVAVAMFLFTAVRAMQAGVDAATTARAGDTTLVVYRKDRYCPFTSRMPQSYAQQIERIAGVQSVVPIKIVVSNCRTSLDVVTFRGVPTNAFLASFAPGFDVVGGSLKAWESRSDAALLGETLAVRRKLSAGDRFEAAGITVYVAGVIRSTEASDQNVAYVHLDFLQYASKSRAGGIVTQFNVKVRDPDALERVASEIDAMFAAAQEPTKTSPEKAFVARAAADVIEIVGFMRWLGWGCLGAVLALVGNAIMLSVQDRIREHAILQTLGFRGHLIARLLVSEGLLLSVTGAAIGGSLAFAFLSRASLALSVESHSIPVTSSVGTMAWGVVIAAGVGVIAGLAPAWQAARREIVACFRAV